MGAKVAMKPLRQRIREAADSLRDMDEVPSSVAIGRMVGEPSRRVLAEIRAMAASGEWDVNPKDFSRPSARRPGVRGVMFYISDEADRVLDMYARINDQSRSDVVDRLIREKLQRYRVVPAEEN